MRIVQSKKYSTTCKTSNVWLIVQRGCGRVKGLGVCWKFKCGWLVFERVWGRVNGLGGCWKFKWGWLVVERGLVMIKILAGCCKFEWRKGDKVEG